MAQDIQEIPPSGFVDSDGLQIYFERYGAGPPMILVHGWGADTRSNWVDTGWTEALKEHRTLISIDVRGHGKSDKPHALDPYSYAAMSRDVLVVMDTLKIDKADFMGYSMGSFMGAYLLGHHAERFTAMVLGGIGDETELSAAQGSAIAQALRAPDLSSISDPGGKGIRMFVESNPNNDLESLAYSALKMWPEGYPIIIAGDNIGQARLPVLIVNGENDHPYVESADRLAAVLPNGKHLRIPGTDHLTTVTDDHFKQAVIEFLTSY
jgi:pimeloyl-ACP methyl ester carboxylesterase